MRSRLRRRLPAGLAAPLRSAPARVRSALARVRGGSSVTAVVVVTDDNAVHLAACLESLAAQTRPVEELLLAVAGTGPEVDAQVRAAVGTGVGAAVVGTVGVPGVPAHEAAARAVAQAAGELVLPMEAGDVLTPGAVAALAGALDRSGSDLALAAGPATAPGTGLGLADRPDAVAGCGRAPLLLRRERAPTAAWAAASPPAPRATWVPALRALVAATSFDVVADPVRRGRRQGTGVSFSALPRLAPHAPAWAAAVGTLLGELDVRPPGAAAALVGWLLAEEAPAFLDDAERCGEEEWAALAGAARTLVARAGDDGLGEVPVEARVRVWLAAEGRRADLERFAADRWLEDGQHPTTVRDGAVHAVLPVDGVPEPLLARAPAETALRTQLRRARWAGAGRLELEIVAYVPGVGAEHGPARARLALVDEAGARTPVAVTVRPEVEVRLWTGERFADHADRVFAAAVDVAELVAVAPRGRWRLEVAWECAGVRRSGPVTEVAARGSAAALPARSVRGRWVRLDAATATLVAGPVPPAAGTEVPTGPAVEGLALEGAELVVRGRLAGADGAPAEVALEGARGSVPAAAGSATEARLRLRHDPWGQGETALPSGGYRLRGVRPAEPLLGRLPAVLASEVYRARVQLAPEGALEVVLGPPLTDDEVGPVAQERLRRRYAEEERRVDPRSVLLQSYTGQSATDSPRAIHEALRRLRPELRLRWAVADSATAVPEGGEPVVVRSRAWYDALATSGAIVTNVDMEGWFCKRPGQRLLQTFHGYPSKAMGIAAWTAKELTPLRVERQLRRTSATWDLLLTPAPEMDEHYRRQYRYDGPILAAGYPRDDALVGEGAAAGRMRARELLGIGDRTAVLYAPTWRDDLATGFRSAALPTTFEVERAAAELGDGYVLLMRGHRFHRRQRRGGGGARLLDVTDHPEVNDLVLACDAAVLDYSSLRFDVALTGAPMVFLVPDLHRYEGAVRGFLYDFRSSAPGPLLETTDEVLAALRDLDGVRERWAPAYARFNARFNRLQDGHAAERVVAAFFGSSPDRPDSDRFRHSSPHKGRRS